MMHPLYNTSWIICLSIRLSLIVFICVCYDYIVLISSMFWNTILVHLFPVSQTNLMVNIALQVYWNNVSPESFVLLLLLCVDFFVLFCFFFHGGSVTLSSNELLWFQIEEFAPCAEYIWVLLWLLPCLGLLDQAVCSPWLLSFCFPSDADQHCCLLSLVFGNHITAFLLQWFKLSLSDSTLLCPADL